MFELFFIEEHDAISDFLFGIVPNWALNLVTTLCKQVSTILYKFDLVFYCNAWCNYRFSFSSSIEQHGAIPLAISQKSISPCYEISIDCEACEIWLQINSKIIIKWIHWVIF